MSDHTEAPLLKSPLAARVGFPGSNVTPSLRLRQRDTGQALARPWPPARRPPAPARPGSSTLDGPQLSTGKATSPASPQAGITTAPTSTAGVTYSHRNGRSCITPPSHRAACALRGCVSRRDHRKRPLSSPPPAAGPGAVTVRLYFPQTPRSRKMALLQGFTQEGKKLSPQTPAPAPQRPYCTPAARPASLGRT